MPGALAIAPGYEHARNGLFDLYTTIGMLDRAAEQATDRGQRAYVAALNREALPPEPGETIYDGYAAQLTGDLATAHRIYKALVGQWGVAGEEPMPQWASVYVAAMIPVFEEAGDPLAETLMAKLADYVEQLGDGEWAVSAHLAAASLAALQGDDDAAVAHLSGYAATGYGGRLNVERDEVFASLHDRADFHEVIARLEADDAEDRAAILRLSSED